MATEVHGISNITGGVRITLAQSEERIHIDMNGVTRRQLTSDEARYLASKLRRLATRIDYNEQ